MDATAGIIILLFVITIFYASAGEKGRKPTGPPPPVFSTIDQGSIPYPYFLSELGESFESRIQEFILTFTKKRVTPWDANLMASSITKYGKQYNVNPKLVTALICRESSFNPFAVSSSGAMGLGQLLPSTAKSLDVTNPFDIDQNILGTTRYVRLMLERWDGHPQQIPLALASYAEGYNAVTRNGGYSNQTRQYIQDIIKFYWAI